MKKLVMLLLCIILLVPLASAAKVTQTFGGTTGLDLRIPPAEFVKQNTEVQTNMHVFNLSDGLPLTNETASCIIHVFNSSGNHIIAEDMDFDDQENDFLLNINKENLSVLGFISFIVQCNTSSEGGFVSGSLRITADGEDDSKTDTSSAISIGMFLLFITIMLFVFPIFKDSFTKHKWANNIIRRAFWTVGLFVLMWNASIFATIADSANLDIVSHLFRYMAIFGWAGYLSAVYMVLKSLFEIIGQLKISKDKKRFEGGKGGF